MIHCLADVYELLITVKTDPSAFGPAGTVFSTTLLGWEMFHLGRVFHVIEAK